MVPISNHLETPSPCSEVGSSVSVKNLQLPYGIVAPNVWGNHKEQPALVTVVLHLNQGFTSAASKDALDENTIHYGELSKQIRAACTSNQTIANVLSKTKGIISKLGTRKDGSFKVSLSAINVELPKASMSGQSISLAFMSRHDNSGHETMSWMVFAVRDVKIMTLIGVNDYERTGSQPVVANLELSMVGTEPHRTPNQWPIEGLFKLERTLTNVCFRTFHLTGHFTHSTSQIIQDSSFETLEALADTVMKQLEKEVPTEGLSDISSSLRLGKPKAVVFAEAAEVQVVGRVLPRSTKETSSSGEVPVHGKIEQLNILKPYV